MTHLYWLADKPGHGIRQLQQTRDRCAYTMCGLTNIPKAELACFADDADCPRCLAINQKEL